MRIRRIRRIRQIFWKCVTKRIRETNLLKIDWIRDSRYKTNLFKSGFVIHDTVRIHGFAKRIHVFTNLLYESRNLNFYVLGISYNESLIFKPCWIKFRIVYPAAKQIRILKITLSPILLRQVTLLKYFLFLPLPVSYKARSVRIFRQILSNLKKKKKSFSIMWEDQRTTRIMCGSELPSTI